MDKFYKVKDISQILQIHWQTVLSYIKSGKLKALRFKREYRIDKKDLEDFIELGKKGKLSE